MENDTKINTSQMAKWNKWMNNFTKAASSRLQYVRVVLKI